MSDMTTGSAALAGNPASDPAAGATGGDAGQQNITTTGLPGTPDGATSSSAPTSTGTWIDSIEDAELKGYVSNKGWSDPAELAKGYQNLEKLLGSEKMPMPKGPEDAEGWIRVYDKLGRPVSPDGYGIKAAEGADPAFANSAMEKFHQLGLSEKQGQELANWWAEQSQGLVAQQQQQTEQNFEKQLAEVKTEWGDKYDENVELGRRAAREYGLDAEKLGKLESALGTAEMMKLMASIGRGQGEAAFHSQGGSNSFGMSPEAARARVQALKGDKGWTQKYLSGDADARSEMERLMRLGYPE